MSGKRNRHDYGEMGSNPSRKRRGHKRGVKGKKKGRRHPTHHGPPKKRR